MPAYNYKKGLTAMLGCFFIWGFQPLYWYLCGGMDTFFLMASRIVWAAVCCVLLLWMQGKLPQLAAAFKDKQVLKREIPRLVVFAFGAVIFKEKISWRHFVIIAIVVVGIVLSTSGFGGVPYVTIALAAMFAIYAAIKKSLTIDSIVSTTMEIIMMVPVAIVFVLCCRMGDNGMGSLTVVRQLLLMGSGVVTAVPMLFYAIGVRNLPLMTTGICQYLSPTLAIFCGMIMGESLTKEKLVSFCFIWAGVILYTLNSIYEEKKRSKTAA